MYATISIALFLRLRILKKAAMLRAEGTGSNALTVRSGKKRAFTQCAVGIAKTHISAQSYFINIKSTDKT
jgi:hypothetical protein